MTGGPRAFRRPAPRTGSPPARIGGTDPTDDANLGADALIAKGEAAVRLGRYEQANEAFAAARAITAAEKTRGSPPSFAGLGDAPHDALEAKAAERDAASEAKAELVEPAAAGEAGDAKADQGRDDSGPSSGTAPGGGGCGGSAASGGGRRR